MEVFCAVGYGSRIIDGRTTVEKVLNLLELAPSAKEAVYEYCGVNDIPREELTVDDFEAYLEDTGDSGIPRILADVINECEGLQNFGVFDDDDSKTLLFFYNIGSHYNEKEKYITEEELTDIINKYAKMVYDEYSEPDFMQCYVMCD